MIRAKLTLIYVGSKSSVREGMALMSLPRFGAQERWTLPHPGGSLGKLRGGERTRVTSAYSAPPGGSAVSAVKRRPRILASRHPSGTRRADFGELLVSEFGAELEHWVRDQHSAGASSQPSNIALPADARNIGARSN